MASHQGKQCRTTGVRTPTPNLNLLPIIADSSDNNNADVAECQTDSDSFVTSIGLVIKMQGKFEPDSGCDFDL